MCLFATGLKREKDVEEYLSIWSAVLCGTPEKKPGSVHRCTSSMSTVAVWRQRWRWQPWCVCQQVDHVHDAEDIIVTLLLVDPHFIPILESPPDVYTLLFHQTLECALSDKIFLPLQQLLMSRVHHRSLLLVTYNPIDRLMTATEIIQ